MGDYRKSHVAKDCGQYYDGIYADAERVADAFYWEHFEKPLVMRLFAEISTHHRGSYLDFAAGTGRISVLAAPYFDRVVCLDVSESMLKEARKKVPQAEVHIADVTAQPIELGRFHVISMFRFLLNAQPELRESALRWVRSAMEPGGFLIVNNHMNVWSTAGLVTWLARGLMQRPLNYLSERQTVALLKRCGFEVVHSYGFRMLPSWRGKLVLPSRLLLGLEQKLSGWSVLQRLAKDRVYVCRPV